LQTPNGVRAVWVNWLQHCEQQTARAKPIELGHFLCSHFIAIMAAPNVKVDEVGENIKGIFEQFLEK
jgi:hypothetical protein